MTALLHILWRVGVFALCLALGVVLMLTILDLPAAPVHLAEQVHMQLDASGVTHPVTAVLLNFRGYDTLLEIAVLLLALLGVLALHSEDVTGARLTASPQAVLQSLARVLAPLMVLVAGYLLWAGSHQPGGAFQAGAVLAAAGVMLYLAGLLPAWAAPSHLMRAGLVFGFMVFILIAALGLIHGELLQYPQHIAGALILAIEASLTLSIGLILAGLFLWLPNENEEAEE